MPEESFLDESPGSEHQQSDRHLDESPLSEAVDEPAFIQDYDRGRLMGVWEAISRAGLAETTLRMGTHALLVALILIFAWGMRELYLHAQDSTPSRESALAAAPPTPTPTEAPPALPPFSADINLSGGIPRIVRLHTDLPSLPRTDVITYIVQPGDTLFGIAEKFGLKPETILWGNTYTLGDNPHSLRPDQELFILPVDGVYYRWSEGDGLNGVAKYFGVTPEDIINYPGNHLNPETIGDWSSPNIEPGTYLIIPGGQREFISWSIPPGGLTRDNPGVASGFGSGVCGAGASGAVGTGAFLWPAPNHFLSGFDYNPGANHRGIDIDGETGDPIYAADSGVVVYSGWNDWGYGNVVIIDHGNGWQTLYAHLNDIYVGCGQSVAQGSIVAAMGSTGNSTGSHLHFEMIYNGSKVNPWDYVQ